VSDFNLATQAEETKIYKVCKAKRFRFVGKPERIKSMLMLANDVDTAIRDRVVSVNQLQTLL